MAKKGFNVLKMVGNKSKGIIAGRKKSLPGQETTVNLNAKKVFGGEFDGTADEVPFVMKSILEYFDVHGVKIEGLFRISGTISDINHLIEEFNRGKTPNLLEVDDPHIITGLLKKYLRDLPDPIIPYSHYEFCKESVNVQETNENNMYTVKHFLTQLPLERRVAFKYLMSFLYKLSQEKEVNKMTPINIALVFGPNVMRPHGENIVAQMNDTPYTNKFFEICLLFYPVLFADEPDPGQIPPDLASSSYSEDNNGDNVNNNEDNNNGDEYNAADEYQNYEEEEGEAEAEEHFEDFSEARHTVSEPVISHSNIQSLPPQSFNLPPPPPSRLSKPPPPVPSRAATLMNFPPKPNFESAPIPPPITDIPHTSSPSSGFAKAPGIIPKLPPPPPSRGSRQTVISSNNSNGEGDNSGSSYSGLISPGREEKKIDSSNPLGKSGPVVLPPRPPPRQSIVPPSSKPIVPPDVIRNRSQTVNIH